MKLRHSRDFGVEHENRLSLKSFRAYSFVKAILVNGAALYLLINLTSVPGAAE